MPDSIKQSSFYKAGQLGKSLEEAFLSFDSTLTDDDVIKELKVLAGVDDEGDEEEGTTTKVKTMLVVFVLI